MHDTFGHELHLSAKEGVARQVRIAAIKENQFDIFKLRVEVWRANCMLNCMNGYGFCSEPLSCYARFLQALRITCCNPSILPWQLRTEVCALNLQTTLARDAARAKVWAAIDLANISPKRLKKLVREGIPNSQRHDLWLQLSGADVEKARFPQTYFAGLAARYHPVSTSP